MKQEILLKDNWPIKYYQDLMAKRDVANEPLASFQQQAYKALKGLTPPSPTEEDWKYTNIDNFAKLPFQYEASKKSACKSDKIELYQALIGKAHQYVSSNGSELLSDPNNPLMGEGGYIGSLRNADQRILKIVKEYFAKTLQEENDYFRNLNSALFDDLVIVYCKQGIEVKEPVHLVFNAAESSEANCLFPRVLVIAEKESKLTLMQSFVGEAKQLYLCNSVCDILIDNDAEVNHYCVNQQAKAAYHFAKTCVLQKQASKYRSYSFSFGDSILSRNEINVILQAEFCECTLNGLNIAKENQHIDCHTSIDHQAPNSISNELYKGIYAGTARGVFSGTVIVRPDAQKTNAFQSNKSLLLSENARSDSRPQLKIWADDVKCSHGATVGQLDRDALFYLRSRGIPELAAQKLLIHAFAGEVLSTIDFSMLREYLEKELNSLIS